MACLIRLCDDEGGCRHWDQRTAEHIESMLPAFFSCDSQL